MMKRIFLQLTSILFFLTSTFAFDSQKGIQIYPQPDCPIQLSNPNAKWRISIYKEEKVDMLTVNFVMQNVSNKNIRAYTLRQFMGDFKTDNSGSLFGYSYSPNGALASNQQSSENWGEHSFNPKEIQNLKLAVDFVEFTDGTIWGMDISKSAEQFAGIKAGTKAGQEHLQKINQQNGIESVINAFDEIINILPPPSQSQIWQQGFKRGLKNLIYQIKKTYKDKGIKELEEELQKEYFLKS